MKYFNSCPTWRSPLEWSTVVASHTRPSVREEEEELPDCSTWGKLSQKKNIKIIIV